EGVKTLSLTATQNAAAATGKATDFLAFLHAYSTPTAQTLAGATILSVDQGSAADVGKSLDPTLVNTPYAGNYTGAHGVLHVNADGTFTYTATGGGRDQFVFTIRDGDGFITKAVLNVTAVSTNHAAVLSADTRNLTETNAAADISTAGTLTISDVDSPTTFVAQPATVGLYGTFAINTAGAWTYTVSSAHNEFVA